MENVGSRPTVGVGHRNGLAANQDGHQRERELPKLRPTRAARDTTPMGHRRSRASLRTRSAAARDGRPEARPCGRSARAAFPAAARQGNGLRGRCRGCPGRHRAQRAPRRGAQPRAFPERGLRREDTGAQGAARPREDASLRPPTALQAGSETGRTRSRRGAHPAAPQQSGRQPPLRRRCSRPSRPGGGSPAGQGRPEAPGSARVFHAARRQPPVSDAVWKAAARPGRRQPSAPQGQRRGAGLRPLGGPSFRASLPAGASRGVGGRGSPWRRGCCDGWGLRESPRRRATL